ncbi:MAG: lipoprotein [Steroidobacteraceae bacterium]
MRPERAAIVLVVALAGCGQKGPLYLPEPAGEVITRPMSATPAQEAPPAEAAPAPGDAEATQPQRDDGANKDDNAGPG